MKNNVKYTTIFWWNTQLYLDQIQIYFNPKIIYFHFSAKLSDGGIAVNLIGTRELDNGNNFLFPFIIICKVNCTMKTIYF